MRIWNVSQGSSIRTICFDEIITNIRFSAAPPFPLAVGTLDNAWSVVDASSGLKTHQADDSAASNGHKDSVYSVDFSPDGKHLFSASLDRTVKMWELGSSSSSSSEAHKVSCSRTFTGHKDFVLDVTLTPDGKWLLSASKDRGVMIWDVETGVPHALLQGHKNSVIRIDVSPDGQYIATASGDMSVRIWSISTITPN